MAAHDIVLPGQAERHGIIGTTRTGKSCHLDWEMRGRQEARPDDMQLLVDTKPRFRAEVERGWTGPKSRQNAAWRYQDWAKGPVLPNSVLVPLWDDHPFRGLWQRPGEIAVMQSGDPADWVRMLTLMKRFTRAHIGGRTRHVTVDEILDFYGRTTHSIQSKNDVFYEIARSGGERMIGETLGAQRVHAIPIMIRNSLSRLTLYQTSEAKEVGYLSANGIPDARPPAERFVFYQWQKEPGGKFGKPFKGTLELPEEYLAQLSAA